MPPLLRAMRLLGKTCPGRRTALTTALSILSFNRSQKFCCVVHVGRGVTSALGGRPRQRARRAYEAHAFTAQAGKEGRRARHGKGAYHFRTSVQGAECLVYWFRVFGVQLAAVIMCEVHGILHMCTHNHTHSHTLSYTHARPQGLHSEASSKRGCAREGERERREGRERGRGERERRQMRK